MKRTRAEFELCEAQPKIQRRSKNPIAKPQEFKQAARKTQADEKRPTAPAPIPAASISSPPSPTMEQEEAPQVGFDALGESGSWFSWGIEEELLLGWFPFVDEHFLCSQNRGGWFGSFWEEEEDYHDIWKLLHIHEIPNSAK